VIWKKSSFVIFLLFLTIFSFQSITKASNIAMNRLYNPNSGEHFYTADNNEKNALINAGWNDEGIGWHAPTKGEPVYRMYNPNAGDHHYTTKEEERKFLQKAGWRYEGIGWYSGGTEVLHRTYNPNAKAGSHHYTMDKNENEALKNSGWDYEGIAWYGYKESDLPITSSLPKIVDPSSIKAQEIISKYLSLRYDERVSQYFSWKKISQTSEEITFDVSNNKELIGRYLVDKDGRLFEIQGQKKVLIK
jgi:hypothetical protein